MFCCFGTSEPAPGPASVPPPNDEPPPQNGAAKTALMLTLIFGWFLLNWSFAVPTWDTDANRVIFVIAVVIIAYWGIATAGLEAPNQYVLNQRQERLDKALKLAGAKYGISQSWYTGSQNNLKKGMQGVGIGALILVVYWFTKAFPNSPISWVWGLYQGLWTSVHGKYSEFWLFVGGVWGGFMVAFWLMAAVFGILEFTRPKSLLPFKCQEDVVLTKSAFARACVVALINCAITLGIGILVAKYVYPLAAPNGNSAKIPEISVALMHLVGGIPLAEITFYWMHRLMHTQIMWRYVHYFHHEWHTPTAVVAIYAHPLEHLLVNIPTVILGPLLTGMHLSILVIWALAATISTCHGHCGWNLPIFGSPQQHDYHHSQGYDNLGTLNVLDTYYHTNQGFLNSWESKIDKTYSTPDYPVDKILARNAAEEKEWSPAC